MLSNKNCGNTDRAYALTRLLVMRVLKPATPRYWLSPGVVSHLGTTFLLSRFYQPSRLHFQSAESLAATLPRCLMNTEDQGVHTRPSLQRAWGDGCACYRHAHCRRFDVQPVGSNCDCDALRCNSSNRVVKGPLAGLRCRQNDQLPLIMHALGQIRYVFE